MVWFGACDYLIRSACDKSTSWLPEVSRFIGQKDAGLEAEKVLCTMMWSVLWLTFSHYNLAVDSRASGKRPGSLQDI